jgi:hypothetical protein
MTVNRGPDQQAHSHEPGKSAFTDLSSTCNVFRTKHQSENAAMILLKPLLKLSRRKSTLP